MLEKKRGPGNGCVCSLTLCCAWAKPLSFRGGSQKSRDLLCIVVERTIWFRKKISFSIEFLLKFL